MASWEVAYDPRDAVPALSHRVVVLVPSNRLKRRPKIRSGEDVFGLLSGGTALDREAFWVLAIDEKDTLLGVYVAHIGGTSAAVVEAAVVIRMLLITEASKTVFVHNHPSASPTPSREDILLTQKLTKCLDIFSMQLVDHVILAGDGFFSFRKSGLIR
jgi:DNA repair protein RadC